MNSRKRFHTMVLVLLGLSLTCLSADVHAQHPATLSAVPSAGELILDHTTTVSFVVTAGANVNAFDVTVHYDPAMLALDSWLHGGYLSNLSVIKLVNTPGVFRLVCTQLATPPKSGDGILLNLVFRGVGNGISLITIANARFSDSQGNSTYPILNNGSLHVHADPALIASYPVTASLRLQGQRSAGGITLSLGYGLQNWLGPYSAVSTGQPADNVRFPNVYQDTYRLTTGAPRYLGIPIELNKLKSVGPGSTAITPLWLQGGNAVWQDEINGVLVANQVIDDADVQLILSQYLQTGAELDGDVNYSGRVDIFDLAMVGGNYGLTSELAYQDWIP